nr:hypothetical protein [Sphingobacterium deserti]
MKLHQPQISWASIQRFLFRPLAYHDKLGFEKYHRIFYCLVFADLDWRGEGLAFKEFFKLGDCHARR